MTDSQQCITLWGTPHSLYTGKIRSYLIKKGISFRERMPAEPAFQQRVVPVVGAVVVPILELADGTIVQDTSDMIDHLEQAFPARPMLPSSHTATNSCSEVRSRRRAKLRSVVFMGCFCFSIGEGLLFSYGLPRLVIANGDGGRAGRARRSGV